MGENLVSVEAEIAQLTRQRPHVVLLGAGASRQAFPNGEACGRRLPLMNDFTEIVPVAAVLERVGCAEIRSASIANDTLPTHKSMCRSYFFANPEATNRMPILNPARPPHD